MDNTQAQIAALGIVFENALAALIATHPNREEFVVSLRALRQTVQAQSSATGPYVDALAQRLIAAIGRDAI